MAEITELAKRLTQEVNECWHEFPPEKQEAYTKFAYAAIQPIGGGRRWLVGLVGRIFFAFKAFRGELAELYEYVLAMQGLVDAILSAIERSHMTYEAELIEGLEEALAGTDNGIALNTHEDVRVCPEALPPDPHRKV